MVKVVATEFGIQSIQISDIVDTNAGTLCVPSYNYACKIWLNHFVCLDSLNSSAFCSAFPGYHIWMPLATLMLMCFAYD